MERLTLTEQNFQEVAGKAGAILNGGGIVLYPTDTLYGLGADAFSDTAVARIYTVKDREEGKPVHAIVSDLALAQTYGDVPEIVSTLIQNLPKGKITFIIKKKPEFNSGIVRDSNTFGFRIPDNEFCIEMIRAFGHPVTATSANKSGEMPARDIDGILAQLHEEYIDLVIDSGELAPSAPSTVLDLSGDVPRILREGYVARAEIAQFIHVL